MTQDYAWIGIFMSLAILLTHCIFIGNSYGYKMDNLIIFAQTIFYFIFMRVLISNPVCQFYYGWSWMHVDFYPNYFESAITGTATTAAPYALYNLDANFIRNAGSSISFILTFLFVWAIVSLICYLIDIKFRRY